TPGEVRRGERSAIGPVHDRQTGYIVCIPRLAKRIKTKTLSCASKRHPENRVSLWDVFKTENAPFLNQHATKAFHHTVFAASCCSRPKFTSLVRICHIS